MAININWSEVFRVGRLYSASIVSANYPSPLFIFDTILSGEGTSRFSDYLSDWKLFRFLLFASFLWVLGYDKYRIIDSDKSFSFRNDFQKLSPLSDYFLPFLDFLFNKLSFFSAGKPENIEKSFESYFKSYIETRTGTGSTKSKGNPKAIMFGKTRNLVSNILKYGAHFYLGTGVKSYTIQMHQISNIVNLGANRAERFGWGTERITIFLEGAYTLKPFRIWDNTLKNNQDITLLQSLYYHIVRLYNSSTSINPGQGYPTWPSLGEILSYVLETFFREFGHQTFFLVFLNRIYYGWVSSLNLSRSAESPMVLTYRLNFEAHPASGWLITDTYAISKGIETIMSTKPEKTDVRDFISSKPETTSTSTDTSSSNSGPSK